MWRGVSVGRLWPLWDATETSLLSGCSLPHSCFKNQPLKLRRLVSLVFACVLFGSIATLSPVAIYDSSKLTVLRFPKTAFGDDAQGSMWSTGFLGIVCDSIWRFAHSSAVASSWLLTVVFVALMLHCRSSSSLGSRAAVNLFPSSCLPLSVWRSLYL